MTAENWRNVVVARNKAEQLTGDEELAATDEGWVDESGDEIDFEDMVAVSEPETGDDTDPQLDRACDVLRGLLALQGS